MVMVVVDEIVSRPFLPQLFRVLVNLSIELEQFLVFFRQKLFLCLDLNALLVIQLIPGLQKQSKNYPIKIK